MKIEYIKLKNFTNIKTAQNANEIEIDFSKSKNRIVLLTGVNGSGKTSVLSCLHPFATNGNLDIRNDSSLIVKKQEGYKEIHISNNNDLYIIKHFYYVSKETHTVKSYITKNNIDLNPNGNVTSFKETIKDELDIEMDYLKLSRLGNNVTNFIDLKTTERKTFMGKILDEVDIYLKYFKVVSDKMRERKSIITHTTMKLSKLNISDLKSLSDIQDIRKSELNGLEDIIRELNNEVSICYHHLNDYNEITVLHVKRTKITDDRNKLFKKISKYDNEFINDNNKVRSLIKELDDKEELLEASLKTLSLRKKDILDNLDICYGDRVNVERELNNLSNNQELNDIDKIIDELKTSITKRSQSTKISSYEPKFTKQELDSFICIMDNLNDIALTTYEFGREPIIRAINNIIEKIPYIDYAKSIKKRVNKNRLNSACELIYDKIPKMLTKEKKECNCAWKEFYDIISDYATEIPDEIVEDEEFSLYVKMATTNINTIMSTLEDHRNLIEKFDDEIKDSLSLKSIFNSIDSMQNIYKREPLFNELSKISIYEIQEKEIYELNTYTDKRNTILKSLGGVSYLEKHLDDLNIRISSLTDELNIIDNDIVLQQRELREIKDDLNTFTNLSEMVNMYTDAVNEISNLTSDIETVIEYKHKIKMLDIDIVNRKFEYSKLHNEYINDEFRISEHISLTNDLKKLQKEYDEMLLVRNSLSAKEGVPLYYIERYLSNVQKTTNGLLELVYDDNLYIDNFNITADEFGIPYTVKGESIKDVSHASQGEKSFISIALSFALIYESISKYNILLLDEIDATLDTYNRKLFLQIIEKMMEMIDAEQTFIISHNNMFSMYPVDVIDMANKSTKENGLANYIELKYN